MIKTNLMNKTKQELLVMGKELQITGRWDMTKEELIVAIHKAREDKEGSKEVLSKQSATDESEIDNQKEQQKVEVKSEIEKELTNQEVVDAQKMFYIENAQIGALVAFKTNSGKVKSAKVTRKSTKHKKLMLETAYGAGYIVHYSDIIWVRTGKRWPKGIYRLLKGVEETDGENGQTYRK